MRSLEKKLCYESQNEEIFYQKNKRLKLACVMQTENILP